MKADCSAAFHSYRFPKIQPWLDFNNIISRTTNITKILAALPQIQPCSAEGVWANFSQICQNGLDLFDRSESANFLTYGLWAMISSYYFASENTSSPDRTYYSLPPSWMDQVSAAFEPVGLQPSNESIRSSSSLQANIAVCSANLYYMGHQITNDYQYTPYSCSKASLFEFNRLEACFTNLCSPKTSNPDIGGIGVYSKSSRNDQCSD